jgi:uncharacterized membrane protein YoaK (UPF0700 family)
MTRAAALESLWRDDANGPLPRLLLLLTIVTGLVDAFSYLVLGHVFVANMTGNVIFVAFALAGAPGFSVAASLVAVASFVAGAGVGGATDRRLIGRRDHLLAVSATGQAALLVVAVALSTGRHGHLPGLTHYGLIVALGLSMGLQNAAARRLGVPDLTTTVLTLTITGVAADTARGVARPSATIRRVSSVAAMFAGGLAGALLVLHAEIVDPLALAVAAVVAVAVSAAALGRTGGRWTAGAP